ncbi:hypothetical protein BH23ACT2_BH23ACT2_14220 [soil metagenome]
MVVASDSFDLDDPVPSTTVPRLLVEVLSPPNASYDRLLKRDLYEPLGVPHYWIVDPGATDRDPSITALRLDADGAYQTVAEVGGEERFAVDQPFALGFALMS